MKSKFFTFLLAMFPGVGHLYLGLMTRGLQFMILFSGAIFVTSLTGIDALLICLPIIWFYNVFDALQKYDLMQEGIIEDESLQLFGGEYFFQQKWVAYIFIGLGGYILIERAVYYIQRYLDMWNFMYELRTVIVALIFMFIGWRLLSAVKPAKNGNVSDAEKNNDEGEGKHNEKEI